MSLLMIIQIKYSQRMIEHDLEVEPFHIESERGKKVNLIYSVHWRFSSTCIARIIVSISYHPLKPIDAFCDA